MGLKIYKFEIPIEDEFSINLPKGAKILTVQEQQNLSGIFTLPYIWVLLDPDLGFIETRRFRLAGTGHSITEYSHIEYDYINTFQMHHGELILHLFEIIES